MTREDRPHGVGLRGRQRQLLGQISDHGVRTPPARPAVVTGAFIQQPPGGAAGDEHDGEQGDRGDLGAHQRGSTSDANTMLASGGSLAVTSAATPGPLVGAIAAAVASKLSGSGDWSARPSRNPPTTAATNAAAMPRRAQ